MLILGIETSHDDTSIALLKDGEILDMWTISQIDIFKEFGGTIPEVASREHVKNVAILEKILVEKYNIYDIDYVAYTQKPGLIGTLQVGYLFAYAISLTVNKPLIPINHLHGHLFSATIENEIKFPALCLLVSGGHTQIIYAKNVNEISIIGQTLDDAVGEAFDKISSRLNLGFPGGPIIDKLYSSYNGEYVKLTKPHTENKFDFSFSGLKTQVLNLHNNKKELDNVKLAVSFQKHAVDYLIEKFKNAMNEFDVNTIILGGGVSANKLLRNEFLKLSEKAIVPSMKYTTDNAAMIAQTAWLRLKDNKK